MAVDRGLGAVATVGVVTLTCAVVDVTPALAHGAPSNPVSRAVACDPDEQRFARSKACQAAAAVAGTRQFTAWDNLRVANVNGRDRRVIPDGRLCSGGIPEYRGLDLPRADWPVTRLTPGARFSFRYAETIPHEGTFKLFVTKAGYDPTQPLRWSDLESQPFLTVTDPARRGNTYAFDGTLPRNKNGRHLIYTIWQNSSTPDTYYSCSDVIFREAGTVAASPDAREETSTGTSVNDSTATPPLGAAAGSAPAADAAPSGADAAPSGDDAWSAASAPRAAVGSGGQSGYGKALVYVAAGIGVIVVGGWGALALRRRRPPARF